MLAVLLMNRMATRRRVLSRQKAIKPVITDKKPPPPEVCRTCLNNDELVSIFYCKDNKEKRSEDLRLVTGLEILMNDGFSQKMCTQCVEFLNTALQFRRTCKKAEKALKSVLHGARSKRKLTKSIKSSKLKHSKLSKTPKLLRSSQVHKIEEEEAEYEPYDYSYSLDFNDDFQGYNFDNVKLENTKPKIKQKMQLKKRMPLTGQAPYKCHSCAKEFRMKATYKAHMRFHTNYCVCETCGKRCRNNYQLQEHKRARHGLGKIHKCAYCEYSSATKEALIIHERRHTGERPYICDHCGATFHRRSNLVQHIAIHLPEKNFQCSQCPKREKSKKLLAIHAYKAHQKQKYRYICPICQDSFSRPGNVRQHLTRAHLVPRQDQGVIDRLQLNLPISTQDINLQSTGIAYLYTE